MTVRNSNDGVAGIGQVVLITLAATATIIFHLTLENSFASVLRHPPASRDADCCNVDKESLAAGRPSRVLSRSLRLCDRMIAFCSLSSVSPSLRASIHEFARSQSRVQSRRVCNVMPASHPIPIISIPEDSLGLGDEEMRQARKRLKDLQFSTGLAKLDVNGHLIISEGAGFLDEDWLNEL